MPTRAREREQLPPEPANYNPTGAPNIRPFEHRNYHVCTECGGYDPHPRHRMYEPLPKEHSRPRQDLLPTLTKNIIAAGHELDSTDAQAAFRELLSDNHASRHTDCCAAAGCPAEHLAKSCHAIIDEAGDRRGVDLLHHLVSRPAPKLPEPPPRTVGLGTPEQHAAMSAMTAEDVNEYCRLLVADPARAERFAAEKTGGKAGRP